MVVRRPRLGRKEPALLIIGVDYHPSFQQIAFMNEETGECGERRLNHSDGEAERFYKELKERGVSVPDYEGVVGGALRDPANELRSEFFHCRIFAGNFTSLSTVQSYLGGD